MTSTSSARQRVQPPKTERFERWAWLFMRYSGILLIPLVWIHVLIQDVLVGVHAIDIDYVALRWAILGWRVYDMALLGFAFAHGVNGLRNILQDYVDNKLLLRMINWALLLVWALLTLIGAVAIIGGVQAS